MITKIIFVSLVVEILYVLYIKYKSFKQDRLRHSIMQLKKIWDERKL